MHNSNSKNNNNDSFSWDSSGGGGCGSGGSGDIDDGEWGRGDPPPLPDGARVSREEVEATVGAVCVRALRVLARDAFLSQY
jgi:hypothetical protein